MGNEMVVEGERRYPLTAMAVVARVRLIQEVMRDVMKKDTHYGVIPGCQKPSLWKPGAEQLLVTFRIATEQIVEDLSTPDEARYRVSRRGTANGEFVGSAVGECSSSEEKYKWRGSICDAEYEQTPEDRRRLKFKRDGSTIKQVRTNIADVANTCLKMADKRATVALALNATAASDCFSQDLEDLPEEVREAVVEGEARTVQPPKPKVTPAVNQVFGGKSDDRANVGTVEAVIPKDGGTPEKPWRKYGVKINGEFYGTFNEDLGTLAEKLKGKPVKFAWTPNAKKPEYKDLTAIEAA